MSWYDIISKRFIEKNNQRSLDYLIYSGDTKITVEKFRKSFKKLLQFNSKKVLEIGCGTGAVLYLFYKNGSEVYGIDFVSDCVKCAQNAIPNGHFCISEAKNIPFGAEKFDLILSNSAFQYFESVDYVKTVIYNMLSRIDDNGECIISDLFCKSKKEEYKQFRTSELGITEDEWKKRYDLVTHLYLDKIEIKKYIEDLGYVVKIEENSLFESDHRKFRFDLKIRKGLI